MYVTVAITPRLGRGLVIPDSGVFRTGTHDVVFIDRGDGYRRQQRSSWDPISITIFGC